MLSSVFDVLFEGGFFKIKSLRLGLVLGGREGGVGVGGGGFASKF